MNRTGMTHPSRYTSVAGNRLYQPDFRPGIVVLWLLAVVARWWPAAFNSMFPVLD